MFATVSGKGEGDREAISEGIVRTQEHKGGCKKLSGYTRGGKGYSGVGEWSKGGEKILILTEREEGSV